KLMTALVAAETVSTDTLVKVTPTAVAVEGSSLGLRAGDTLSMGDLLTGLLLSSGNDAANAVAETVAGDLPTFAQLMNSKAAALGMQNSTFVTPSGLDAAGHAASAYDMALLGRAVLQNDFLRQVCSTKSTKITVSERDVWVTNHNRLLKLSADCIGMKTGFTKKAGRCLVSAATRDGVTIVVATLNGGDYWNDHLKLYEYAFSRLESITPKMPNLPHLNVAGGVSGTVALSTVSPPAVTVNKGATVDIQVQLPAFLWAPVTAGDAVGWVTYRVGDVEIRYPVTAGETVTARPRMSAGARFLKKLQEISKDFLT
ncbi:MAG: D-alanyl-D-alanine carboxypeptidase, partial [Clostridia bacterium]|nr:D-alanyl-D-alanine carboxypeptidase [Clostridia bacterium]